MFDNELGCEKKPLGNFINEARLDKKKKDILIEKLSIKLLEDSNIFLATIPLVNGKVECEIEDLFQQVTLEHKIDEKTFCPKDRFDNTKYYGKELFSQYISTHYKSIDFSGFEGFLDNLNTIIESY